MKNDFTVEWKETDIQGVDIEEHGYISGESRGKVEMQVTQRPQHLLKKTVLEIFQFEISPRYSIIHNDDIQANMLKKHGHRGTSLQSQQEGQGMKIESVRSAGDTSDTLLKIAQKLKKQRKM